MITPSIRLARPLGAGGMGLVWIADHLTLGTEVVVKLIADPLANNREAQERFRREAAAASQVKSPHVVQVMESGVTAGGRPYIVMELLEGEDLAHRLAREPVLPPQKVASIVGQVARALGRAHDRGVIHRDIKPENIFLCDVGGDDAFVKVLDFGIAKGGLEQLANGTSTGAMLGTPFYMSPEQVMGRKDIDHRTDLWSLAVVAFEALTGRRPFDGETVGAISVAICHGDPPSPRGVRPELGETFEGLFKMAFARDREQRFRTARALGQAFEVAAGGAAKVSIRPGAPPDWSGAYVVPSPEATPPRVEAPPAKSDVVLSHTPPLARPASLPPATRIGVPLILAAGALLGVLAGLVAYRVSLRPTAPVAEPASEPTPAPRVAPSAKPSTTPLASIPEPTPPVTVAAPTPPVVTPPITPSPAQKPPAPASAPAPSTTVAVGAKGKLVVSASGGWCQVTVDGKPVGPTPTGFMEVSAGPHLVTCAAGTTVLQQSATVVAGETARVKFVVQ